MTAPTAKTRVVSTEAEAADLGFLLAERLMPPGVCRYLAELHAANAASYETGHSDPFWNGRLLGHPDVESLDPLASAYMTENLARGVARAARFFEVSEPLYADTLHLVGWPVGASMPPHADNAHEDGAPHELAHRVYSGVFYLTDAHEGGELYLPKQDVLVKPGKGTFISLPAGLSHVHGVTAVEAAPRTTMAFFLTFDQARAQIVPQPAA